MNWSELLQSMSEETFKELHVAVYKEETRRIVCNLRDMPDPTIDEKNLWKDGMKVPAIKIYRERTKILSVKACQEKFESCFL